MNNNFGFNNPVNLNNENPLMQYIRQYTAQQQPENIQPTPEPQRSSNGGIVAYEISSKSDIEYIEPDKSGRKQIYICENENKVYTGRYNHVRKEMDYRAYVDEGDISLFQKNDTDAGMSQIAEALLAVVNKLGTIESEIQELKNIPPTNSESQKEAPKSKEPERRNNGQFKKKGES